MLSSILHQIQEGIITVYKTVNGLAVVRLVFHGSGMGNYGCLFVILMIISVLVCTAVVSVILWSQWDSASKVASPIDFDW